jgi:hypothetical protein
MIFLLLLGDSNGNLTYFSKGYKIGVGEQLVKNFKMSAIDNNIMTIRVVVFSRRCTDAQKGGAQRVECARTSRRWNHQA